MDISEHLRKKLERLNEEFPERVKWNEPLGRYSSSRLGGPAAALVDVRTAQELVRAVSVCWELSVPFRVIGGGSNVLVSDRGFAGLVIVNRTRQLRFAEEEAQPLVWAETGVNLGLLARLTGQHGLSGLEWAASIPGSLGGAMVGNAGAFGRDMAASLYLADILHLSQLEDGLTINQEAWSVEKMEYAYRSSIIKRNPGDAIVIAGTFLLDHSTPEAVQTKIEENVAARKRTQPPGASMGSIFKNPAGDYAGRLIEAAGLKGRVIGGAEISPVHANFIVNTAGCTAQDYYQLIMVARKTVAEKFGIQLELEVELVGEW